jgi:hypothetical protein
MEDNKFNTSLAVYLLVPLKGQCHEIFCFWFFSSISSPQPQIIPLGPFQIFSKIHGDIRSSRLTTGQNEENLQSEKF